MKRKVLAKVDGVRQGGSGMRRRVRYGWAAVDADVIMWWNPSLRLMKKWFGHKGAWGCRRFVKVPEYMAPDMEE